MRKILKFIFGHYWLLNLIKFTFCFSFIVLGVCLGLLISYYYFAFAIFGGVIFIFSFKRTNWKMARKEQQEKIKTIFKRKDRNE